MTKLLFEYDRYRDNYLPACEKSKLLSLIKGTKKLNDKDLTMINLLGFQYKITSFDMPQSHFKEQRDEIDYPTMKINRQPLGFDCYHFSSTGKKSELIFIDTHNIEEAFLRMMKDPNKPKD